MKTFGLVIVLSMLATPVSAQWLKHPTAGVPRTSDGKPNLTAPAPRTPDGKIDLSGQRRSSRGPARSSRSGQRTLGRITCRSAACRGGRATPPASAS
jgi:hypothetical protein